MRVLYTNKHLLHNTDDMQALGQAYLTDELPERIETIRAAIQKSGLGEIYEPSDFGLEHILKVHTQAFVDFLRNAFAWNQEYYKERGMIDPTPPIPATFAPTLARRRPNSYLGLQGYFNFGAGTPILEHTWEAAYWSAQCALSGADYLRQAAQSGTRAKAYALCRPPGHHAAAELYGGFCYLNNAAIATRYLGGRSAILDIDYHHGNGTQEIFYHDPDVFYCSLHAHPDDDYPFYWGDKNETGEGPGAGTNLNIPLPQGCDDSTYLDALEEALAAIRIFRPDWLVISTGFDTLQGDPVGGFNLTMEGLKVVGARISELDLPTLFVQEGGYKLDKLGECAVEFFGRMKVEG